MNNINLGVSVGSMNSNNNMANNSSHLMQQMQKVHMKLEDLRLRLNEPIVPLTNEAILHLSTELQPLYKALIMYNLDEFITRNLETALWNDCFKTPLTRYGRTDKNLFNLMIESGVGFYLGLIQDIGVHFDISFITNAPAAATKLYCTSPLLMNNQFIKPAKSSIYFIIQNCLLHVGDLLRYRGTSYAEAIKMYEKSAAVCPSNGYPYHQMGLTQLLIATTCREDEHAMDGFLSCLYYFARSLSVSNRYLPAFQSIESLIKSKVETETKTLPVPQEMVRLFMLSIYENCKAANLFALMTQVVQTQQVNASTLVKMIVIALWNNWRNQFSNQSLDIIACIFNSIVGVLQSVLGESQVNISYCLPHLKLLMEWMSWHQDTPAMAYLYTQINRSALVTILNHFKQCDQFSQNPPNTWVLEAILPEEKKLIGFIPMDYSVCFNAGSSGSGGAIDPPRGNSNISSNNGTPSRHAMMGGQLLSEDKDRALSFNLRIHRVVCVALKLASNKNCILYDGKIFMEKPSSPSSSILSSLNAPQPSRRNVALQSIFRTANTNNMMDNLADSNLVRNQLSPTSSCASSFASATSPGINNANNFMNSGLGSTTPGSSGSTSGLTTSHDFFRSIWTPDTENTESKWY